MNETLIGARGIGRTFPTKAGDLVALADVDIEVRAGELVVVRGPSGSGKTTLLNLLGALDRPTTGTITLADGRELSVLPESGLDDVRRDYVGFIFQSFGLIPALSAEENVEMPLRMRRTEPGERRERVAAALAAVGLAGHSHQRPDELSGGQQQRVGIARALVAEPRVLLADEPTAQLDSRTALTIMDLLQALADERGVGMLVTTHDPKMAERAQRLLGLEDGRLLP
nr:ABC transporter ATP-binding protein [Actinomycetales bacterium]